MQIGKTQRLKVTEKTSSGYYLEDQSGQQCFVPQLFGSQEWETGSEAEVFVYQDENQLKATIEKPYCEAGEFAVLTCVQTLPSGAFMDWGIVKDLFVPYKQQKGKKVQLILINETELGWNVVINQKYIGLVYASDVYKKLYPLSEETGYIKLLRKDGKIDVSLQPEGYENIDSFKEKILEKLRENYGLLYLSDQSAPEEIKAELQMSKKNFKKAIGGLYRDKMIEILEDRIRLL